MGSVKRYSLTLPLALCAASLAGWQYWSVPARTAQLLMGPASEQTTASVTDEPLHGSVTRPGQGFVLTDKYGGQQGAAIASLVSLQCWMKLVGLVNVSIVEPFVQNSVLSGPRKESSCMSDMFDLEMFNHMSCREGAAEIVPYSTYLRHAPQRAIYVGIENFSIRKNPNITPPSPELFWAAPEGSQECYQPTNTPGISPPLYPDGHNYCYVRVIRAYHRPLVRKTITVEQLQNTVLGGEGLEGVTLVLSLWRSPWRLGACPTITITPPKVRDSPRLLEVVECYKGKVKLSDWQYVAVMFRSEHAYLMIKSNVRFKRPTGYTIQKCVEETVEKAQAIMAKLNLSKAFMTADVGRYGSHSWRETLRGNYQEQLPHITHQVEKAVETLYQGPFQQWERGFIDVLGGIEDSGYVAAMQRVLASRAACLILLGGGSFQRLALASYLYQAEPKALCVHLVCMDRAYETEFKRLIKQHQT